MLNCTVEFVTNHKIIQNKLIVTNLMKKKTITKNNFGQNYLVS